MTAFFSNPKNALCTVLLVIGAFFLFMTYGALIESKLKNTHISGVPCVGGLCILIGFLTSTCKPLCLLCFLDYGFIMIPWAIVLNIIHDRKDNKKIPPQ